MTNDLSKPYYRGSTYQYDEDLFNNPYDVAKRNQAAKLQEEQYEKYNVQPPSQQTAEKKQSHTKVPHYEIDPVRKSAQHHVKLVVVGDGGCGKTCLLISYSQGTFPTTYIPTIFENYVTNLKIPNSRQHVELALWDTAGQEEYDRLRPLSYADVDVILICYAVDAPVTLGNVKEKWAPEVKHFCPGVPIILVGTKLDIEGSHLIPFEEAELVKKRIGALFHIRCSAKTTENINDVFDVAIHECLKQILKQEAEEKKNKRKSFFRKAEDEDVGQSYQAPNISSDYYRNSEYALPNDAYGPKKKTRKSRCNIL
ncbi:hypothetical protein WICPIJ_000303 [Wickerhamomyces pijperi]|uniref:GTP-binding protein RHO4 n=1 Tax=Wickerhamomyces pijperi TaxID=599730 RepID=A0A9P8QD28_WICPI|nr:hypothetical protein WICPIJ_000303 [Wickerhamomyces pijperi]